MASLIRHQWPLIRLDKMQRTFPVSKSANGKDIASYAWEWGGMRARRFDLAFVSFSGIRLLVVRYLYFYIYKAVCAVCLFWYWKCSLAVKSYIRLRDSLYTITASCSVKWIYWMDLLYQSSEPKWYLTPSPLQFWKNESMSWFLHCSAPCLLIRHLSSGTSL